MKVFKKAAILSLFFLLWFVSEALCNENNLPLQTFSLEVETKQEEEFAMAVRKAIENNDWLYATNKEELEENLSLYYADPLLGQISDEAWKFIQKQTDWYSETHLNDVKLLSQSNSRAVIMAHLTDNDITTGEKQEGECTYILTKTSKGWRIISADYRWKSEHL